MILKNSKLLPILLLGLGTQVSAQQAVVASGGNSSGTSGTASYSVGQIFYTSNSATNGSNATGVQQPIEVSEVLKVEDFKPSDLGITVYPNPTTSYVNLEIKNFSSENFSYDLYDLYGRLITSKKLEDDLTKIDMERLPSATFFLIIKSKGQQIKHFKLLKKD